MGVHVGHRERLRRRFAEHGLENFDDVNVLELLLFYVRPRQDTNELAHRLIDYFGSIDRVFDARLGDLERVEGVGRETAAFLHLIPQVSRRYMERKWRPGELMDSAGAAGRFLLPLFAHERSEVVYMVCLDARCAYLNSRAMARGTGHFAEVSTRSLVEYVLGQNAAKAIVAHNHPQGLALPSREDEIATEKLLFALASVEVELVDHIIVAGQQFASLAESGLIGRARERLHAQMRSIERAEG